MWINCDLHRGTLYLAFAAFSLTACEPAIMAFNSMLDNNWTAVNNSPTNSIDNVKVSISATIFQHTNVEKKWPHIYYTNQKKYLFQNAVKIYTCSGAK